VATSCVITHSLKKGVGT